MHNGAQYMVREWKHNRRRLVGCAVYVTQYCFRECTARPFIPAEGELIAQLVYLLLPETNSRGSTRLCIVSTELVDHSILLYKVICLVHCRIPDKCDCSWPGLNLSCYVFVETPEICSTGTEN